MKNKIMQLIMFTIFISLIINTNIIKNEIIDAIKTFIYILFPSIFPFFLISDLLINYNFPYTLNYIFGKVNNFLFHTSNYSNYVIIMSLFSGFPSGSKYISDLYNKKLLTLNQANYLITFTHFSNPIFVITTTQLIFKDIKISYIILISHILANFIIAFIIRPKEKELSTNIKVDNPKKFSISLSDSIKKSMNLMLMIFGNTCFFFIVSKLLTTYLNTNNIVSVIINGFFDITKGIKTIYLIKSNYMFKASLILSFLAFGGVNINMQVANIINKTDIKYRYFLLGRISQSAISIILFTLFYLAPIFN